MARKYVDKRKNNKKNGNGEILGLVLIIVSAIILLCLIVPIVFGPISEVIRGFMLGVVGFSAFPIWVGLLILGVAIYKDLSLSLSIRNRVCLAIAAVCALMIVHLATTFGYFDSGFTSYTSSVFDAKWTGGGVILGVLCYGLHAAVGTVFSYVIMSIGVIIPVLVMCGVHKKLGFSKKSDKKQDKKQEPASGASMRTITTVNRGLYDGSVAAGSYSTSGGTSSGLPARKKSEAYKEEARRYVREQNETRRNTYSADSTESSDRERAKRELLQFDRNRIPPEGYVSPFSDQSKPYGATQTPSPQTSGYSPNVQQPIIPPMSRATSGNVGLPTDITSSPAINGQQPIAPQPTSIIPPPMIYHTETPPPPIIEVVTPPPKDISDRIVGGKIDDGEEISRRLAEEMAAREEHNGKFDSTKVQPTTFKPIDKPATKQNPIIDGDYYESTRGKEKPDDESVRSQSAAAATPPEPQIYSYDSDETVDTTDTTPSRPQLAPIIDGETNEPLVFDEKPQPREAEPQDRGSDLEELIAREKEIAGRNQSFTEIHDSDEDDDEYEESETTYEPTSDTPSPTVASTKTAGLSFNISDDVEDLSESSFGGEDDNTGYYEREIETPPPASTRSRATSPRQNPNQLSLDDVFAQKPEDKPAPKPKKTHPKYVAPPTDLLVCNSTDTSIFTADAEENARILEKTLESLKFPATVSGITCGPAVTRYELEVPPGTSVRTIDKFASDIEYNLACNGKIRIETPIPGKRAVGIEVPNAEIATVGLRDLIESKEFKSASSALTLAIGKDIGADNIICNLEKMPHLLIAGATGSGKSACLNSIIASILYKASPEDVRLILIDPKEVEFRIYQGMPHLLIKEIITDAEQAIRAFKWAKIEMDRRYKLLSQYCVRNIQEFNSCAAVRDGVEEKLPRIVVIVDELCELMMSPNRRDLEDKIMSMAQKARAAGLHLILATQRPSVDVITGTIKANLPSRIAFAVTSFNDSRTILDQGGAESLLGKGDMLYAPSDSPQPKRVQGAYITTEEVDALVKFVKEHNECYYDESVSDTIMKEEPAATEGGAGEEEAGDDLDPLIKDVLRRVIETGNASTSMIQRRFYVGYARASRIMDQMEMKGFIGPLEGTNKPREVFITADKFREMFGEDL